MSSIGRINIELKVRWEVSGGHGPSHQMNPESGPGSGALYNRNITSFVHRSILHVIISLRCVERLGQEKVLQSPANTAPSLTAFHSIPLLILKSQIGFF